MLDGIQHAHQKGLIHRDLKPSNVLVYRDDSGDARLKIIDFGIAKATDPRAAAQTLFTVAGRLVGTPAYMSPEQATLEGTGVDTRSDLYSASVLLYELLTGAVPFPSESLLSAGYAEMQRIIREDDPPPPSRRLESLDAATLTGVAAARGSQVRTLQHEVAGDLDWIVMKGLEKDPARRYDSAAAFAADLRRFLDNLPVAARPPSSMYRLRKFVHRHTVAVAAAGFALIALVGFTASTLWQARELTVALESTRVEQRKAEQVTRFLIDLLAESDPGNALGRDITVREALDKGADRLRSELTGEPHIRAAVLIQMAEIYRELGDYDNAEALLGLVDDTLATVSAPQVESLVELHQVRANLQHDRGDLAAARVNYLASIEAQRTLEPLHANVVRSLEDLGVLHIDEGDYGAAIARLEEAVDVGRRLWPNGHVLLATSLGSLAYASYQAGRNAEAAALFEQAVAMHRGLSSDGTPELAYVLSNYGNFHRSAGNADESIALLTEVAAIYREVHGEEHPYYATSLINLGSAYNAAGRLEDSERTARDSIRLLEKLFAGPHPNKASAYYQLGAAQAALGRYADAEASFRLVLKVDRAMLGDDHPYVFSDLEQLAVTLKRQDRIGEAEQLQRQALEGRIAVLGPEHPDVAGAPDLSGYSRRRRYRRQHTARRACRRIARCRTRIRQPPGRGPCGTRFGLPQRRTLRGSRCPVPGKPRPVSAHAGGGSPEHRACTSRHRRGPPGDGRVRRHRARAGTGDSRGLPRHGAPGHGAYPRHAGEGAACRFGG
ncbi:MAG: serine/threonine-protein kinase [Woeseiaceae bacterium]|nr:serine/threonine-protein kinase [Woeseiaceae bacterium]